MCDEEIEREKLFALIWEKPSSEVAKELGISGVALGKRCRRLQVPKPPRGYWAKVHAGRRPRRPVLGDFLETASARWKQKRLNVPIVLLTQRQSEFLERGIAELKAGGRETVDCKLSYDGILQIDPAHASELLILIQNRYEHWLGETVPMRSLQGAQQCIRNLVGKLLPLAKEQLVIFRPVREPSSYRRDEDTVMVRLSPTLLQSISHLADIAQKNNLSYAVRPLRGSDYTYGIRYLLPTDEYGFDLRSDLCVSTSEIWLRTYSLCDSEGYPLDSERVPLKAILPMDRIPQDIELPPIISVDTVRPYANRLKALEEETRVYDILSTAAYRIESAVPGNALGMAERLLFDEGLTPFTDAREASLELDGRFEAWERSLDAERERLCQNILGIRVGDNVLFTIRGKECRIQVKRMYVSASETDIYFSINGTRYRKDGTLGKRDEQVFLNVDNSVKKYV